MAFIGRERELAVLGSALQGAAGGKPARVVVTGALGMGTSRLMDELVARVSDITDMVVCRGRCYEPRANVPYAALADALGVVLERMPDSRLADVIGPVAPDVVLLLPALRARLRALGVSIEPYALDAPRQRGARMREALAGIIGRLAGPGALVLMIEDLEHSDAGTREFLGTLMRIGRRRPLALLVTYHPDEIGRGHPARTFVKQLEDARLDVQRVALAPLDRDEITTLVEAELDERPTLALLAALQEGSRGNPLLVEQLLAAQRQLDGARLSDPLDDLIDARLDTLDHAQVRVLRVLALARRPLTPEQLAEITLPDGHLPLNAVDRTTESGFTTSDERGIGLRHVLLAESIDNAMLPEGRHVIHAALAPLLFDCPAEQAWHLEHAGRRMEARAAHLVAARFAERIEPGATTLTHFVAALELGDGQGTGDDVELLAAAATAADAAGQFRRAAALCAQAIELVAGGHVERLISARASSAARARAAALCEQLGRHRRSSGDSDGARRAFEQALAVSPPSAPVRAAALAALAQQLMLEGAFVESTARAEQARNAALTAGESALGELAHATDTAAVDAGFSGQIDRGLELLDEALDAARQVGDLDEVMRCYANQTTLLDLDLRREQALAVVKEGIAEAQRNGLGRTYGAFLGGNAADILFQLGRWKEAEAECRTAMEFPPAGVAWFSPILYLGLVLVEARADEEAAQLVGQALLQLEAVPAGQWSALVLRSAVSLALWRGDLADAHAAAEQGWPHVLETEDAALIAVAASTVLEACAAEADAGRLRRDFSMVARATALAAEVIPVAERYLARHPLPATVGARREAELHMASARAHHERVRGRTRPETYAALAEAWAVVPVPYQVAKARWWQAQAALPTRARRPEARRALREAWLIAGQLPAVPLRRALRDLAQRGRITLPADDLVAIPIVPEATAIPIVADLSGRFHADQPSDSERLGLSPREFGVLLILAEGRTNREIADRLFISERTVAVHVRRILHKLGVSGRVEAAGVAIRQGLLPDDRVPGPAAARR